MRGLDKVDCEGFIASLAYNLGKAFGERAVAEPAAPEMVAKDGGRTGRLRSVVSN